MSRRHRVLSALGVAAFLAVLATPPAGAADPLLNCRPGVPFTFPDGGRGVSWNPDRGRLGFLGNAAATAQSSAGFAAWEAVGAATASFTRGAPLPVNVDSSNFVPWLLPAAPDGRSAVVYDENGEIFDLLFGAGAGVLGFAGPEWGSADTCRISESSAWINGGALFLGFPADELQCVQHHEFGHFINLAHSVVNGQIAAFADFTGPAPHDTFGFPASLAGRIETMSPLILVGGGQCDAHADDVASISNLYPAPGHGEGTGTITGRVLAPNGRTPLTGVNVIARSLTDPFDDAVSAISSGRTDDFGPESPLAGHYTLSNLTPGARYAVYVDRLIAGGFSTPPRATLPGPEELYNGTGESGDSLSDDPSVFTPLAPPAGSPLAGIDIIFNGPRPGQPLPLGDDTSFELFLPFSFALCGETHDSLHVNSNGSLTFGGGDADRSESAPDLLSGPPRIAGLWDDLNPARGGHVTFLEDAGKLIVSFRNVPEFPARGSNSFDVVLSRSSGQAELEYGLLSSRDGLAGLSCGGARTTGREPEEDLTLLADLAGGEAVNARHRTALYEVFGSLDGDLAGRSLKINVPGAFRDTFEKNDTFDSARKISLPFSSGARRGDSSLSEYSEIRPAGGDADFFRFKTGAGRTLLAEVTSGRMDSVLGLFDGSGRLIAVDDDGGAGRLSRIQAPAGTAGEHVLAVSTFPDLDFTGDGDGDGGARYVLEVRSLDGIVLPLGDDDTMEVEIEGFTFPFQGALHHSVFVNSNGSLSFGAGDTDHTESVPELLSGPARIAPLWDDLNPAAGGQVLVEQDRRWLRVSFERVPEWPSTGGNTFSVTLLDSGDITMEYGATNGNDGLAGVTSGGGAGDPGPSILGSSGVWPAAGTTYQLFPPGTFGLDFTALMFVP